jgi:hypothetical protein
VLHCKLHWQERVRPRRMRSAGCWPSEKRAEQSMKSGRGVKPMSSSKYKQDMVLPRRTD